MTDSSDADRGTADEPDVEDTSDPERDRTNERDSGTASDTLAGDDATNEPSEIDLYRRDKFGHF